jgi:Peptidyl-prolyl cis-trans isomerase (rotamase) - cyclophilin family
MKLKYLALFFFAATLIFACKNNSKKMENTDLKQEEKPTVTAEQKQDTTLAFCVDSLPEEPIFNIATSMGTIKVKLYKETPLHKKNFIKLASERFYDNILFHRIIKGFMIQVGDPLTKDPNATINQYGTGGPGYTIPAEILPQFTHKKGALAAARRGDTANPYKESSGSQFYIVHNPEACVHLDGEYSIFGETLEGFDVIDKIATAPTRDSRGLPVNDIKIISILPAE